MRKTDGRWRGLAGKDEWYEFEIYLGAM
jgi:hypothetical protein